MPILNVLSVRTVLIMAEGAGSKTHGQDVTIQ